MTEGLAMFERFTDSAWRAARGARRAVVLAQEEARSLQHNYIGTEHLLLALLVAARDDVAPVLRAADVDLGELHAETGRRIA